ncbi:hypothetical protein NL676_004606 [Syzygium grande]|nr:hypothetical protein NL676_004606 [Syzygium grande]
MVAYNFAEFLDDLTYQVQNNVISMSWIDDAMTRILRVKFVMGLSDNSLANQVGNSVPRSACGEEHGPSRYLSEPPYGQTFSVPGPSTISNVCWSVKCMMVVISGHPINIEPYVSKIDALVATWLPGTEGKGVADLPFGDYGFPGKLAGTRFMTVDPLLMNVGDLHYHPLYPFGFGLTTKGTKESNPTYS